MKASSIKSLRRHAIASTLFEPSTLLGAIENLGFVQCDPIRAPARAQDLILRQRVVGYRAGDLERHYPDLPIEEDYLYAYGIVAERTWRLLHPRSAKRLTKMEEKIRALVSAQARLHPRELEAHLGRKREVNAWGSYSKSTTLSLETLHYHGHLRVAGRDKGIRLYQAARVQAEHLDPADRLRQLVLLIANILAPVPARSLLATLRHLRYSAPALKGRAQIVKKLMDAGDLSVAEVDGVKYVWPKGEAPSEEAPSVVRFLAPFDPLVWDRYRFELFWGWAYRFEAYTPPPKRKLGYYALPLLWKDDIIGWANVAQKDHKVTVEPGFVNGKPTSRAFRSAYADEVERITAFLLKSEE